MAYVVTRACFDCKFTDCIVHCPVECFHEGNMMLYIDPDECIDCDACRNECPVGAIYPDVEVPDDLQEFIELNAEMSKKTPSIYERKTPLCE